MTPQEIPQETPTQAPAPTVDSLTDPQAHALRYLRRVVQATPRAHASHDKGWRVANDTADKGTHKVALGTLEALEADGLIGLRSVTLAEAAEGRRAHVEHSARLTPAGIALADELGVGRWRATRLPSADKILDIAHRARVAGIPAAHFEAIAERALDAATRELTEGQHRHGAASLDRALEASTLARMIRRGRA